MITEENTILIPVTEMTNQFRKILLQEGFEPRKADQLAKVFSQNSLDGVYTHGVNRFSRFIDYTRRGMVIKDAEPVLVSKNRGVEQWNGNAGPGILNALACTERSMQLADEYGMGCVALANTNHWLRGGTYGWQAAKRGYVYIGFTNTIANMPAYGAVNPKLGNNPLIMAIPYGEEAIVLDMAMSQYSFGSMELAAMKKEELSVYGGYDKEGKMTKDPAAILETRRSLAVGYWKGAGLSLLLDIIASLLSGGNATWQISRHNDETALSQVFISINLKEMQAYTSIPGIIEGIIRDYQDSVPAAADTSVYYPGERILLNREKNTAMGIPVLKKVWEEILSLK